MPRIFLPLLNRLSPLPGFPLALVLCLGLLGGCGASGPLAPQTSRTENQFPSLLLAQAQLATNSQPPALCEDLDLDLDLDACALRFRDSPGLSANASLPAFNAHWAYARGATGKGIWLGIVEDAGAWPGGLAGATLSESLYGRTPTVFQHNVDSLLLPEALDESTVLGALRGSYIYLSSHTNLSTSTAVANNLNTARISQGVSPEAGLVLFGGSDVDPNFIGFLPKNPPVSLTAVYYGRDIGFHLVHGVGAASTSTPHEGAFWDCASCIGAVSYSAQFAIGNQLTLTRVGETALDAANELSQIDRSEAERTVLLLAASNDGSFGVGSEFPEYNDPDHPNGLNRLYRNPNGTAQLPLLFQHYNQRTLQRLFEEADIIPAQSSEAEYQEKRDELQAALQGVMITSVAMQDATAIAPYSNLCGAAADWCLATPVYLSTLNQWAPQQGSDLPRVQDRVRITDQGSFDVTASGTSASAPYTLGAIGLVQDFFPSLSPVEVATRLKQTATLKDLLVPAKLRELTDKCGEIGELAKLATIDGVSLVAAVPCEELDAEGMTTLLLRLTFGRGRLDLKAATEPRGVTSMHLGQGNVSPLTDSYLSLSSAAFGDSLGVGLQSQNFIAMDTLQTPFHYPANLIVRRRLPSRLEHSEVYLPATRSSASPAMHIRTSLTNPAHSAFSISVSESLTLLLNHQASPALLSGPATTSALSALPLQPDSAFASPWADADSQWRGAGLRLQMGQKHRLTAHIADEDAGAEDDATRIGQPPTQVGQAAVLSWQMHTGAMQLGAQMANHKGRDRIFGLSSFGGLGQLISADTRGFNLWGQYTLGSNTDLLWSFWHASGEAAVATGALREFEDLRAEAWSLALSSASRAAKGSRWIWRIEQPLRLYDGQVHLRLPVARTRYKEIIYSSVRLRPLPSGREIRTQLDWQLPVGDKGTSLLQFSLGQAHQPGHIRDSPADFYATLTLSLSLR